MVDNLGVRARPSFLNSEKRRQKRRPGQALVSSEARINRGRDRRAPGAAVPEFASLRIHPDLDALQPRACMGNETQCQVPKLFPVERRKLEPFSVSADRDVRRGQWSRSDSVRALKKASIFGEPQAAQSGNGALGSFFRY